MATIATSIDPSVQEVLVVRATFLNVKEIDGSSARRRARSEPPTSSLGVSTTREQEEWDQYAEHLHDKLLQWGERRHVAKELLEPTAGRAAQGDPAMPGACGPPAQPEDSAENPKTGAGEALAPVYGGVDALTGVPLGCKVEVIATARLKGGQKAERVAEEVVVFPPPQPEASLNKGSLGHPLLCGHPCRFHSEGRCVNGDECGFCHMPHAHRPSHLNKSSRDQWKRLPLPVRSAAAVSAIEDKIRWSGLGPRATVALQEWTEQSFGLAGGHGHRLRGRELRQMQQSLASIGFVRLCNMALGAFGADDSLEASATSHSHPSTMAFLKKLRSIQGSQHSAVELQEADARVGSRFANELA